MPEVDLETLSGPDHGYTVDDRDEDDPVLLDQNGDHIDTWRERYPYDHRMPHDEWWMARAAQV
jgi:polyphosphate kinase